MFYGKGPVVSHRAEGRTATRGALAITVWRRVALFSKGLLLA